ncbi:MAG TPA: lipoyl(octanoyl) transferase LipB, partial [Anaerolineales bacterium]
DLQNKIVEECLAGRAGEKLLLLEHEPVYTIGRTRDQSSLGRPAALPHPLFETNRGGQATWHGPGQLVAYPILNLQHRGRDLHRYLRFLEEVIILSCQNLGVEACRRDKLTGVWVADRKIASIGVGVRRWISMHGLALNVGRSSLEAFQHITPCGISNVQMTCLEVEAKRPQNVQAVGELLAGIFQRELTKLQ